MNAKRDLHPIRDWPRHPAFWLTSLLFIFSLYLGFNRIFQVDEAQNIYTARILSSGWEKSYFTAIEPWTIWSLARFAKWAPSSVGLLYISRIFMLALFWTNIVLIALNCGFKWTSRGFPWVLLGASTLAPLWDYGFEVRHETPCLLILLACLACMRIERARAVAPALMVGGLCALAPLTAFKSFAYFPPILLLYLAFPPEGLKSSRIRLFLLVLLGFAGAGALVALTLFMGGHLAIAFKNISLASRMTTSTTSHFSSWASFERLIYPCPLLVATSLAALAATVVDASRDWRRAFTWSGSLPEAILFLSAIAALLINPTPFPYNLCLLVPFAFILSVRRLSPLFDDTRLSAGTLALAGGILACTHLIPYAKSTLRHLEYTNDRQVQLIELAEEMTDPAKDRVYDAAGLISSRHSIGNQWFLHTLVMNGIAKGTLPSVRQMLTEHPASVIIPNYRFGWLSPSDVEFILTRYIGLSPDFLVLGQKFEGHENTFPCIHPGRYIVRAATPDGATREAEIDGAKVSLPTILALSMGDHRVVSSQSIPLQISWIGPTLKASPQPGTGDPAKTFVNWY